MPIADEWSGLADLLANLIEKYATDLELDDTPAPAVKKDTGIFSGQQHLKFKQDVVE